VASLAQLIFQSVPEIDARKSRLTPNATTQRDFVGDTLANQHNAGCLPAAWYLLEKEDKSKALAAKDTLLATLFACTRLFVAACSS
jgi:hypothetical protein